MIAFCLFREPKSINAKAKFRQKYMRDVQLAFQATGCQAFPKISDLYFRMYYFHQRKDTRDADNFSKPTLDALKCHAYSDDKQVVHRTSANINVEKYANINFTNFPTDLVASLSEAMLNNEPIIYIEIGDFMSNQVQFGG